MAFRVSVRSLAWEAGHVVGIPFWVMWGVVGTETDYGRNVSSSSAGAMGLYQFTSRNKGPGIRAYPMTNSTAAWIMAEQAIAAAQYLRALYLQTGRSWHTAMAAYNAGPGNIPAGEGYASTAEAKSHYTGAGLVVDSAREHPVEALWAQPALGSLPGEPAPTPSPEAHPASSEWDYHEKVHGTGKAAGEHGSTLQRVNVALEQIPGRYRR